MVTVICRVGILTDSTLRQHILQLIQGQPIESNRLVLIVLLPHSRQKIVQSLRSLSTRLNNNNLLLVGPSLPGGILQQTLYLIILPYRIRFPHFITGLFYYLKLE